MQKKTKGLVTVFGGSGFVGRHVVRELARLGYRIRVAVRRPDLAIHLQPLGTVGQIHAVQANVRNAASIARAIEGADAVVNLVGIMSSTGKNTLNAVHEFGAGAIAREANAAGIKTMVHLSSIGVGEESDSSYARSKAKGEALVRAAMPDAVIFRSSVIFGPEDDFFNRFATMARYSPALPLIGGGETKFQPVFVGDVAKAIGLAVEGKAKASGVYELGGPRVASFKELMELMLETINRKRLLAPIPFGLASFKAMFLQYLPGKLLTPDQVTMLKSDNVVSEEAKSAGLTLDSLGITPTPMEAVIPSYLWRFKPAGQFDAKIDPSTAD